MYAYKTKINDAYNIHRTAITHLEARRIPLLNLNLLDFLLPIDKHLNAPIAHFGKEWQRELHGHDAHVSWSGGPTAHDIVIRVLWENGVTHDKCNEWGQRN